MLLLLLRVRVCVQMRVHVNRRRRLSTEMSRALRHSVSTASHREGNQDTRRRSGRLVLFFGANSGEGCGWGDIRSFAIPPPHHRLHLIHLPGTLKNKKKVSLCSTVAFRSKCVRERCIKHNVFARGLAVDAFLDTYLQVLFNYYEAQQKQYDSNATMERFQSQGRKPAPCPFLLSATAKLR